MRNLWLACLNITAIVLAPERGKRAVTSLIVHADQEIATGTLLNERRLRLKRRRWHAFPVITPVGMRLIGKKRSAARHLEPAVAVNRIRATLRCGQQTSF